jgi:methyl-accepting chemotaxis protein
VGEMLPRLSRTLFKIGAMIGYAFGLIGKIVNALTGLGLQGIANVAEIIFQYIAGGADLVIATTNLLIVLVLKLFDLIIGSLETLLGKSFDFSEAKDFFKFVRDSILEGGKTLSDSAEKINTITDSIKFTSDAMKELNDNTDMATEAALKLREQMVGIRSAKDLSDSPLMGGIRKNLVIARDAIQRDLIEKKKLIESEIERIQILIKLTQELPEGRDRNNLIGELRNRLNTYEKIKRTVSEISDIEVDASQKAKDIAEGAAKDKFNTTMDAFSGDQLALEERAALLEQAIENFNSIFGGADKLRLALEYAKEACKLSTKQHQQFEFWGITKRRATIDNIKQCKQ